MTAHRLRQLSINLGVTTVFIQICTSEITDQEIERVSHLETVGAHRLDRILPSYVSSQERKSFFGIIQVVLGDKKTYFSINIFRIIK